MFDLALAYNKKFICIFSFILPKNIYFENRDYFISVFSFGNF